MIYNNNGVWTAFNGMHWNDTNNYLGLGTTNPTYKLDVTGTIQAENLRLTNLPPIMSSTILVVSGSQVGTRDLSTALLPSGSEGQMLYNNNGIWTPVDGLMWDDTQYQLGIGTTNPSYKIDVKGDGLIGGVLLSGSNIGIETDINLISLKNSYVGIDGALNVAGTITASSAGNTINGLVINNGSITTGSWLGSTITVPYGGTGTTSFTNRGLILGSGTGPLRSLGLGTDGQILMGRSGSDPAFTPLGGEI